MKNFLSRLNAHSYILVFLLSALFYYVTLYYLGVKMDVQLHVNLITEFVQKQLFPVNFLYYLVVYLVALFNIDFYSLLFSSILVLAFAVAYKFLLTARFFAEQTKLDEMISAPNAILVSNLTAACLATTLCIYLPRQLGLTNHFYLGQISPNVWHNSTTIFLMPFALLLYWRSYQLLNDFNYTRILWLVALILLNIAIKPSFFFCFIVVFPLMALLKFKLGKKFWLSMIPVCAGFVLLALQYFTIYQFPTSLYTAEKSELAIAPFYVWSIWAPNIPVSFLLSTAFPLAYLVFYFQRVKNETFLYYAYLLFAVALIIASLLVEKGPRDYHNNFFWQANVCNYLLFLAVATDFLRHVFRVKTLNVKDKFIIIIFSLHVFSGWLYIVGKLLFKGDYT